MEKELEMGRMPWAGERLILCQDRRLGARAAIAIDDTTLGPGLGGVRFAAYETEQRAVEEAVRLAAAMTLKNAAAGLPYGGAKSVIVKDDPGADRTELMRWFGRNVEALGGTYIPGVDVGTSVADLAEMATIADDVACHDEDPSPWTALGVLAGIRAAVDELDGAGLRGRSVVVQGAGHVGAELARLLRLEDAEVEIADIDSGRAAAVAAAIGASAIDPGEVIGRECDIFAPCAMARVVNAETVASLNCRIVAGAANDTLASDAHAADLASRGILYVPDFLLNAGGVIQIHALREGWTEDALRAAVLEIGERVSAVLERARHDSTLPLTAARAMAQEALGHPLADPSPA